VATVAATAAGATSLLRMLLLCKGEQSAPRRLAVRIAFAFVPARLKH
jgi:hypothetical protein